MLFISLLIALSLEFHFKIGSKFREFFLFHRWVRDLIIHRASKELLKGWVGIGIILCLPLLVLWSILTLFSIEQGSFFYFIFSTIILIVCLGSKNELLDQIIKRHSSLYSTETQKNGDEKQEFVENDAGFIALQKKITLLPIDYSTSPYRNVTHALLIESHIRYFAPIFWFVLFGPLAVIFYRWAHLYFFTLNTHAQPAHFSKMKWLLFCIHWLPTRITFVFFLFAGDFSYGLSQIKHFFFDLISSHWPLIAKAGVAVQNLNEDNFIHDEHQKTMALIHRTMVIYVVFSGIILSWI
jgi:AmpE protein